MTVALPSADHVARSLMRFAPPAPIQPTADDLDLLSGVRVVRRRLFLIALLTVLITAAFVPSILAIKPVYHAESRLMIHNSLAANLDEKEPGRSAAIDLPSEIERQVSRSTSERVVRELGLAEKEEFNPALRPEGIIAEARQKLRDLIGGPPQPAARNDTLEPVLEAYYRALSVRRDAISNVVTIGFESQDPELAAAVPNALIRVYLDERAAAARLRLDQAESWVKSRMDEQKLRAAEAQDAARKFREGVGPVSDEAQTEQMRSITALRDRSTKIARAQEETEAAIRSLSSDADPGRGIVLPESLAALQRDLRVEERGLESLLQTFGDRAEEVMAQRAKIAGIRAAYEVELSRQLQLQQARLAGLDREKQDVESALALVESQLARASLAQTELANLVRNADTEQAALDKLEQQRRSLADLAAVPETEVEVLTPASVPLKPQGRGRMLYLIGALVAAASIAVTVAFLREMLDKSIRSHEQLAGIAGIAPAGLLPMTRRPKRSAASPFSRSGQSGLFVEAIRSAMVSLRQSNGGRFPHSILVTSALDGEGKSFIARSLAAEFAAIGQPALIVDGDLRGGGLGAALDAAGEPGLNEFLNGDADLADVIYHDAASGIDFIPRGNPLPNRRHYLPDLSRLLTLAQVRGQVVIVDSAPILASTDTVYLAGQVERTLFILQWGRTPLRAAEAALQRLRETNRDEILVAINKVKPRRHRLYGFRDSELYTRSLRKYHGTPV